MTPLIKNIYNELLKHKATLAKKDTNYYIRYPCIDHFYTLQSSWDVDVFFVKYGIFKCTNLFESMFVTCGITDVY